MRTIALLVALCVSTSALAESDTAVKLSPRLDPIAFAAGLWFCNGEYRDVPPFTVAHTDTAIVAFLPDVGGQWIVGSYQELTASNGAALVAIKDSITIDPFLPGVFLPGVGNRVLFDSNGGRMLGNFTIHDHVLEFTGDYVLAGQGVPFTETVSYSQDGRSFSTARG